MKKKKLKSKKDILIAGLGQGAREEAIKNGGGFIAVHRIHKSKKQYSRQKSRQKFDDFFVLRLDKC